MVYILYSKQKKKKRKRKQSSRGVVFNREQFHHPRDIWKHLIVTAGRLLASIQWAEANMLLLSPLQGTRTVAPNKGLSIPKVSSATVKKPSLERKQPSWGRCEQDPTHDPFCPPCPPE